MFFFMLLLLLGLLFFKIYVNLWDSDLLTLSLAKFR